MPAGDAIGLYLRPGRLDTGNFEGGPRISSSGVHAASIPDKSSLLPRGCVYAVIRRESRAARSRLPQAALALVTGLRLYLILVGVEAHLVASGAERLVGVWNRGVAPRGHPDEDQSKSERQSRGKI